MQLKIIIKVFIVLFFSTVITTACMYGGSTMGTGLPFSSKAPMAVPGVSYLNITGSVHMATPGTVRGITATIKTERNSEEVVLDARGEFESLVIIGEGEEVNFSFVHPDGRRWSIYVSRKLSEGSHLGFVLKEKGKVSLKP